MSYGGFRGARLSSPAFTEHFFQSGDGLDLYYRQFDARRSDAQKLTVLCLPGLTRNSRDFESLAHDLAERCHVLTPDLRGRGRSAYDSNWENYNPTRYVEDAFRLLDQAGVQRCVVVGTSLGGLLAMVMGALQPQRFAGLIINDIGPVLDSAGVTRIRSYAGKLPRVNSWEEAGAQAKLVHCAALPDLDDEDWLAFARRTYRQDDGVWRPDVDPNIARAFGDASAAAPDLWPIFGQLALPMLVIRGALSDLFSEQTLTRMRDMHPELRALTVANRGHTPTLDEPECRAAIGQFLQGLRV